MSDVSVLQFHLERAGVGHWAAALIKSEFTPRNIHLLNKSDLKKLRITNASEQEQLLAAAKVLHETLKKSSKEIESGLSHPTASDCCRSAASYLNFHRVDRAWPKPASTLSSNVGLSSATPPSPTRIVLALPASSAIATKPPGQPPKQRRWSVVNQRNCSPPLASGFIPRMEREVVVVKSSRNHSHGRQSGHCECCDHHVRENCAAFGGGQWQFQAQEVIFVGQNALDHVFMWKPFASVESLMIENAWRRKLNSIKIGGSIVDLGAMTWKGMSVRRNGEFIIGFPSLSRREAASAGELPTERIQSLESEFAQAFLDLVAAAEDQNRTKNELEEQDCLLHLRAEIAADVADTFEDARRRLVEAEELARDDIESSLELALSGLWDQLHDGIQAAVFATLTRGKSEESAAVCARQLEILGDLEMIGRMALEDEEQADMINLCKLIARFNAQVRAMLTGTISTMQIDPTLKCLVCNRSDCQFFTTKWKPRWSHRGLVAPQGSKSHSSDENRGHTISALMAQVEEKEYHDFVKQYPQSSRGKVQPPSERLYRSRPSSSDSRRPARPSVPPMKFGSALISPRVSREVI